MGMDRYMESKLNPCAGYKAEIERLRAALEAITVIANRPLPSERNKVTFWRLMAKDMADIARRNLEQSNE